MTITPTPAQMTRESRTMQPCPSTPISRASPKDSSRGAGLLAGQSVAKLSGTEQAARRVEGGGDVDVAMGSTPPVIPTAQLLRWSFVIPS